MGLKINFQTRYGVSGEYVNFDPQISNKTRVNLRMKYWKDETTKKNIEGTIPFNDQMNGSSNKRIVDFNCNYQFDYDLNSLLNIYQQGYNYLHTLREFIDAEDILTTEQLTQLDKVKELE
jgi:hypothetical protein